MRLGIFSGVLLASSLNLRERTLPYDNRLQHADFFDGISKLTKIILIENGTRLMQVRSNITQSQFNEITALHRQQFRFVILLIFGLFTAAVSRETLSCFTSEVATGLVEPKNMSAG